MDGKRFPIIAVQEAGLDGFRIHRVLEREGIESDIADAASITTSRRRRLAKTDRIDGEAPLVRALLAYKRGEPRVCAMVQVPTPEDEDRRRISRERRTLTAERVAHGNRIKGLLFSRRSSIKRCAAIGGSGLVQILVRDLAEPDASSPHAAHQPATDPSFRYARMSS